MRVHVFPLHASPRTLHLHHRLPLHFCQCMLSLRLPTRLPSQAGEQDSGGEGPAARRGGASACLMKDD